MKISGLQKTALLDFPGHVACTIFTGGCNFHCPFYHNSDLLDSGAGDDYTGEEAFEFLHKRKGVLEGVYITGGGPTLQSDLEDFIGRVRELDLAVKLDTNGYRLGLLKDSCQKGPLDCVAMDIKTSQDHYGEVAGAPGLNMKLVDESVTFLLSGNTPYEFRTTVVHGLHTAKDFRKIGPWIKRCPGYYLQRFTESDQVLVPGICSDFTREEVLGFADLVRPYVDQVSLRGTDYQRMFEHCSLTPMHHSLRETQLHQGRRSRLCRLKRGQMERDQIRTTWSTTLSQ